MKARVQAGRGRGRVDGVRQVRMFRLVGARRSGRLVRGGGEGGRDQVRAADFMREGARVYVVSATMLAAQDSFSIDQKVALRREMV